MKKLLLTLSLLIISPTLFSQSITIGADGVVRCKEETVGTTEVIFGDTYEVVDRALLEQRRDEGADLTKSCVSNITNLNQFFKSSNFNQDIGNWDVSSVIDFSELFFGTPFNQDIGNWDVSSAQNMNGMFLAAASFNHDIGEWNVSSVKDMTKMFNGASSFNQNLNGWQTDSLMFMTEIFSQASAFNGEINMWNVSKVKSLYNVFNFATSFNQPIDKWDVSNVESFRGTFLSADSFNQNIGNWDVSSAVNMYRMFYGYNQGPKTIFDKDISSWNVSNVTNMSFMFAYSEFNQDISDWDVSNVSNMSHMFLQNSKFNQNIENWNVSNVSKHENMSYMFAGARRFSQDLSYWCVTNILYPPSQFSENSGLSDEQLPVWGSCPIRGMPNKITLLKPSRGSSNQLRLIELEWSNDSNSTNYNLQIFEGTDPVILDTLITQSSFTNKYPFKSNTQYNWRVRGVNQLDSLDNEPLRGEWSSIWSFTTGELLINSPVSPNLLVPTNESKGISLNPTLKWNKDLKSDTYTIQISSDSFSTFSVNESLADTSYTTPELGYNTQYSWRVRGSNSSGDGEWSEVWSFTTQVEPPDIITIVSPTDSTRDVTLTPTLKWFDDVKADYFEVSLIGLGREFGDFVFSKQIFAITTTDTTYTTPELSYGRVYSIWVTGYNSAGAGYRNNTSRFRTIDAPLESPTLSTPFNEQVNVGTMTEFAWNEIESSASYHLQVSADEGFSSTVFDSSKLGSTSFTLSEPLSENTTYFWRMKSISDNELRNSEWSDTLTFTTGVRTSIEDELMPQEYTLSQNYPNPFNPSTQIQYALPEATEVTLEVFNSVGQKVMELVNGQQSAGYHTATFDASGLSSGVYLYKLTTPSFTETKKMLLIK